MNPAIKIQIEGHTDNVGSTGANQKLSEQRADAVKRFLISKGVEASRISTVGYGASKPINDNKSAQGKAFNRRIEFKVLD
jgi:OOP family OmpA-OmpF porin